MNGLTHSITSGAHTWSDFHGNLLITNKYFVEYLIDILPVVLNNYQIFLKSVFDEPCLKLPGHVCTEDSNELRSFR